MNGHFCTVEKIKKIIIDKQFSTLGSATGVIVLYNYYYLFIKYFKIIYYL